MSSALQGTMSVSDFSHVSLTQRFARLKMRILQGRISLPPHPGSELSAQTHSCAR